MIKSSKCFFAIFLLIFLIFGMFSESLMVCANQSSATVSIEFSGDEAKIAGFAQCEITVTPGVNGAKTGYYLVYYTDGVRVLPDYDEATAIKITGSTAKGGIGDGIMLPQGAKGIAVFESDTYYLSETPNISNAIATAEIPASKRTPDFGEEQFSFGALSDTHMNYQKYDRGAYEKLQSSMNFFAEKGMDIVIIAGDITGDRGEEPVLEAQYEKHVEILNISDFPANKVYEALGNHGNTPADVQLFDRYLGGKDEIHPYKSSPYYHVLFEGAGNAKDNLFIFMAQEIHAPGDSAAYDNFSKKQIDWLESLLDRYGESETNIFIIIHSPFLEYGAGDIENGTYTNCITFKGEYKQSMRLQMLLESYKNSIVMSGHTHVSFYENANYSDLNNKFARTVHIGSNCQPCAYGGAAAMIRGYDGRRYIDANYGSEGYTVEVYSDFIVYTGYNFSTGKKIPAACLLIPAKVDEVSGWMEEDSGELNDGDAPSDSDAIEDSSSLPEAAVPSNPSGELLPDAEASTKPSKTPSSDAEASTKPSEPPSSDKEASAKPSETPSSSNNEMPSENHLLLEIEEEKRSSVWIWILVSILVIAASVAVTVIVICKKK